jgi:hypothetical protein
VGHFLARRKFAHLVGEDTQTCRTPLLAPLAQELESQANAEKWLAQDGNDAIKTALANISHGRRGMADTGKDHVRGGTYRLWLIGDERRDA